MLECCYQHFAILCSVEMTSQVCWVYSLKSRISGKYMNYLSFLRKSKLFFKAATSCLQFFYQCMTLISSSWALLLKFLMGTALGHNWLSHRMQCQLEMWLLCFQTDPLVTCLESIRKWSNVWIATIPRWDQDSHYSHDGVLSDFLTGHSSRSTLIVPFLHSECWDPAEL